MFNQKVITVLTQVNNITNSIILKYPKTVAVSDAQDMMVLFDMDSLDSEEFPDIALNDCLSEFLSLFKLFPNERNVKLEGSNVSISSGSITSEFITDNPVLMDSYNKDDSQFEKTEGVPSVCTFDLKGDDIKNLKSASGVFKDLSELIIKSQDGDIRVFLGATNKFNAKSNTFCINKKGETSREFEIKIPLENFKMIPISDYTFHVKYNSARDSYRILALNNSLQGFKILLSVKTS